MMNRLIDKMDAYELDAYLDDIAASQGWRPCPFSDAEVRQKLERLFAEEPQWSDGLSLVDNQSWVFCFVSNGSREDTYTALWVARVTCDGYHSRHGCVWKYATPVDLNVRFKKEMIDD